MVLQNKVSVPQFFQIRVGKQCSNKNRFLDCFFCTCGGNLTVFFFKFLVGFVVLSDFRNPFIVHSRSSFLFYLMKIL